MLSERAKRYCIIEERTSIFGNHKGYKLYPSLAMFFQFGAEMLAGTSAEKDNVKSIIGEFWNSKYAAAVVLLITDIGRDENVDKPSEFGDFLVGDGHAPATYYVLINDSFMSRIH